MCGFSQDRVTICKNRDPHPLGIPRWFSSTECACQYGRCKRYGFDPRVGRIPWRRKWQPPPVFVPGKPHGQTSLVGYGPWGHKGSDTTACSRASPPINGPALPPDHLVLFQNCKNMAYTDKSFPSGLNLISESWFLWHLYQGLYLVPSGWPWITNCSPALVASASSFHETIIFWTVWFSPRTKG